LTRRKFLKYGLLFGGVVLLDGVFIEPRGLKVEDVEVGIRGLPPSFDGFTVCQITDVHHSLIVGLDFVERAVRLANSLDPDLIVLTGDYIDMDREYMAPVMESLSGLKARHGVLSILGNHDYFIGKDYSKDVIRSHNIPLLENSHVMIEKGRGAICVAGVLDFLEDRPDAKAALTGAGRDVPRILLAHHPDYSEHLPEDERIDLVLSGHTHGGQVRLPYGIAPIVPSRYGQKYSGGLVRLTRSEGTRVYVSRGVGVVSIPVRINCPPEITRITLRPGTADL